MTEFVSETHKATINDGGLLVVWQLSPREVRVTKSTPDGGVDVSIINEKSVKDTSTAKLLQAMSRMPTFAAGYAGGKEWNVDLDCGFQRWRGVKPTKDLSKALTNCGFSPRVKKKIMTECHKHKVDYVPRYG
jgi:hypothetical protein